MRTIKFKAVTKGVMYEPFDLLSALNEIDGGAFPENTVLIQSTGKTDLKGVEIYEGDIATYVKSTTGGPKGKRKRFKATVVWSDYESGFVLEDSEDTHPYVVSFGGIENSEVIGNIYKV